MSRPAAVFLCLIAVMLGIPPSLAAAPISHNLQELAFLQGTWFDNGSKTATEEIWSAPESRTMMCMYREMEGGATTFYEFLVLSEEESGIVLKMKHFDARFTSWEDKDQNVTFDATEIEPGRVLFVSRNKERPVTLEYRRGEQGKLEGVLIHHRDGKTLRDEFHYRAVYGPTVR